MVAFYLATKYERLDAISKACLGETSRGFSYGAWRPWREGSLQFQSDDSSIQESSSGSKTLQQISIDLA